MLQRYMQSSSLRPWKCQAYLKRRLGIHWKKPHTELFGEIKESICKKHLSQTGQYSSSPVYCLCNGCTRREHKLCHFLQSIPLIHVFSVQNLFLILSVGTYLPLLKQLKGTFVRVLSITSFNPSLNLSVVVSTTLSGDPQFQKFPMLSTFNSFKQNLYRFQVPMGLKLWNFLSNHSVFRLSIAYMM